MGADDVDGGEESFDGVVADDVVLLGEFGGPVVAEGVDFHVEGAGADGDFLADAAEADETDFFLPELVAGEAGPFTGAAVVGLGDEIADEGEEEGEGVLGDGGVVYSGGEEDGEAEVGAGVEVDFIEADAVFRDHLEARGAFFEDLAGEGVVSAEEGVEVSCELHHFGFAEGAALDVDVVAAGFEQLVVGAGGVLVGGGGEENAEAHWGVSVWFPRARIKCLVGHMPTDEIERNLGVQPLDALMTQLGLGNHDLVESSPVQLTHKQVARARKGRRLTRNMQDKILVALNKAAKAEHASGDLFNYKG